VLRVRCIASERRNVRGRLSNNLRPAISTCWSLLPATLRLVLCQMTLQQTSNTTHRSGLITPSQTSKRSSSRMSSTQSLNHLLSFTLPPRQSPQNLPRRTRKTNGSNQVWNKEREYAAVCYSRHRLIVLILQDS